MQILRSEVINVLIDVLLLLIGLAITFWLATRYSMHGRWLCRCFGIVFSVFAIIMLVDGIRSISNRASHMDALRTMRSEKVASIDIAQYSTEDAHEVDTIVRALTRTEAYEPSHGNFADQVDMVIHYRDGEHLRLKVATSFAKPGAVIWFYGGNVHQSFSSYGYAFSHDLPEAIEQIGHKLPAFRSDWLIHDISETIIANIRIANRVTYDKEMIRRFMEALRGSKSISSQDIVVPPSPLDIAIMEKDGTVIPMQACRDERSGHWMTWFVSPGRVGPIYYGALCSDKLSAVLRGE